MDLDDDKLIYLDLEFISRKYEAAHGIDPKSKLTKQEGATAGLKALFANAGVSTQESRTFSITSRAMLYELWPHLTASYPDMQSFENNRGTTVAWIEGSLTIAEWKERDSETPGYEFFQLNHGGERTALLTDPSYFSAGFASILGASPALKGNVSIPVKLLARVMWHVIDARNYVACPYIIVERS